MCCCDGWGAVAVERGRAVSHAATQGKQNSHKVITYTFFLLLFIRCKRGGNERKGTWPGKLLMFSVGFCLDFAVYSSFLY